MTNIVKYPIPYKLIKEAIPELNRQQLTELRTLASWQLQQKAGRKDEGVQEQDWLLEGIIFVLNERGLGKQVPHSFRLKNNKSFASYQTQSERIKSLIEDALGNNSSTMELKQAGIIAARALASFLAKEVSFHAMMFSISRIPEAIQRSFPGYIESGLLPLILRKSK